MSLNSLHIDCSAECFCLRELRSCSWKIETDNDHDMLTCSYECTVCKTLQPVSCNFDWNIPLQI